MILNPPKNGLERAEKIAPNDKRVLAIRGLYFYELGDMVKGRELRGKSLALDSQYHSGPYIDNRHWLRNWVLWKSLLNMYFWKAIT